MKKQLDSDMVCGPTDRSCIKQYFSGATILVTGATGLLGRLVIEKLLRTCYDLNIIYALIRQKKGKTGVQRFQEYFDDPVYERLKRENPEALAKLHLIESDLTFPYLGLSEHDRQVLISEVNCIFHIAATVNLDENLRTATYINVRSTKDILNLSRNIKNLKSFVYVSTAFALCTREVIDEVFYESHITGDQLLTLVEHLNEDMLQKICPILLGDWQNPYVFTKSVAEDIIEKGSNGLPIAIVRPSVVLNTLKEPISGWINNNYGPVGPMMGVYLGLLHTMHIGPTLLSDMIPADYVANTIIAAAWDVANKRDFDDNPEITQDNRNSVRIYNCVSSSENPLKWGEFFDKIMTSMEKMPTTHQLWVRCFIPTNDKYGHLFLQYTLHYIPAYISDLLASCIGKTPWMVQKYKNIDKRLKMLEYFGLRQWTYRNENTKELWKKLNSEDKKLFQFSANLIDWDIMADEFIRSIRICLLKDPMNTVPEGRTIELKLKTAHYSIIIILILILFRFAKRKCKL